MSLIAYIKERLRIRREVKAAERAAKAMIEKAKKAAELEARGPVPCGYPEEHWYWTDEGWSCPKCAAKAEDKRKDEELRKLGNYIAQGLRDQSGGR